MQKMYDQASIVICRAGSGTISELGATKNAAIFIPFPYAAGNHQEHNARNVQAAKAGQVLLQTESNGDQLAEMILALRKNPEQLAVMRQNITNFFRPDAPKRIVDVMKTRVLTQNV